MPIQVKTLISALTCYFLCFSFYFFIFEVMIRDLIFVYYILKIPLMLPQELNQLICVNIFIFILINIISKKISV